MKRPNLLHTHTQLRRPLALLIACIPGWVACTVDLNPQPLPPGGGESSFSPGASDGSAGSSGGGGTSSGNFSGSSGGGLNLGGSGGAGTSSGATESDAAPAVNAAADASNADSSNDALSPTLEAGDSALDAPVRPTDAAIEAAPPDGGSLDGETEATAADGARAD
jgi:hypothetical protein